MAREIIHTDKAPAAIGPYSQAVAAGNLVFCSGQVALEPGRREVYGNVREQTHRVLGNLKAVLEAAGCTLQDIVKTTVYLSDIRDFAEMNEVYETYFRESKPARATVEVGALPKEAFVEIDAIAVRNA